MLKKQQVYYTTNGEDPDSASTLYIDAISISHSMTLKAIAIRDGAADSEIMKETYNIVTGKIVESLSPAVLGQDYQAGYISIEGDSPVATSKITFNVNYSFLSDNIAITFPTGTEVTKVGGGDIDLTALTAYDLTAEINRSLGGYNSPGVVRFGIEGMNLNFSHPVTVTIKVGDSSNGKTLDVFFKNEGANDWNKQTTCVVTGGMCTFQTTHATLFSAGELPPGSEGVFIDTAVSFSSDVKDGKTNKEKIAIKFKNIADATKFIVSHHRNFSGADWKSIKDKVTIRFDNSEKIKRTYYVKFSTVDGRESQVFKKSVAFTPDPLRIIKNSKHIVRRGEVFSQSGKAFSKDALLFLYFSKPGGGFYAPVPITTDKKGTFDMQYDCHKPIGTYNWYAVDVKTGKKSKTINYLVQ
ncbi:MAG: FN3 associated domain-containing protein [Candidatus Moraniibacteriota bacterium]